VACVVGATATILVTVRQTAFATPDPVGCLYTASRLTFILLTVCLPIAFIACLVALFPREIIHPPRIPFLVGEFIKSPATKRAHCTLVKQIINQLILTEESIYSATACKQRWLTWAARIATNRLLLFAAFSYSFPLRTEFYIPDATENTPNRAATPTPDSTQGHP